jgi:hypothetical protein
MSVFRDIDLVETSIFNNIFLRGNVTITYDDTPITNPNDYYFTFYGTPITSGSTTGSAATVYIEGAPLGTISNSYAFFIAGGKTYIGGALQIATGASNGYVLTSDATGNATWVAPSAVGSFSDGTVTSPSIYFASDTSQNTGFYRIAEDTIGVTTGGSLRLSIGNTTSTFTTDLTIANGKTTNIGTSGSSSILNIHALTDIFGSTALTGIGNTTITNVTLYVAPISTPTSGVDNYYFSYFDVPDTTGTTTGSAYTIYVAGPPTSSSGSISNPYSVYIATGKTYIGGALQIATGASNGYVLTSDATGNATWVAPSAIGSFSDGTATSPSIYFASDTSQNTGFYRIAEDTIGVATNGTLRFSISNTIIQSSNGITYNIGTSGTTSPLNVYGLITGSNSLTVSGNVNSLTQTITGSTSGVITIQGQSAAGTYNYNLPTTSGTAGQVLTSGGGLTAAMTWTTAGTVTSVALSVPTFLSVSGSPITTNGTLAVTLSGTALPVLNGGTGSTTATGTGSVVLANTPTLITPIIGVATGTSLSVSGNVNSLTQTITGSTSGVITIQGQAVAGTYNYNLPTTAGTAGQVLTSGGGLIAAMTWTTPTIGTVTSVALSVPTFLSVSGSPITTNGTLAVTLSGTALPVLNGGTGSTTATGTGSVVLANTPTLITPIIGVATGTSLSVSGNVNSLTQTITGSTSGVITIQGQAAAGTYNYNLPTTAGTTGQVLTSGGGLTTSMTWTTPTIGTVTSVALSVPTFLSVSGSPITTNGTLEVTLSGTALPVLNGGTGSTTSTGSGSVVLANTPTLITPIIGDATGTSLSVSGQLTSTISSGTAPLVVTSTTVVTNLNANLLNGATFSIPGPIGNTTASTGAFTTITASGLISANLGLTVLTGQTVNIGTAGTTSPLNVRGLISGFNGLTISVGTTSVQVLNVAGLITANLGLTVATGRTLNVGTAGTTSPLNVRGLISGFNGLTISVGTTSVQVLNAAGLITANLGLTVATGTTLNVGTTGTTSPLNVFGLITGSDNLTVSANVNSLTQTITGSTSGVITIQGQAAAGTYNYNLPTTAGTAGQVLTSGGGLTAAMTWTTPGIGTVTSVALSVPTFLSVSGSPITTNGTLAVTLSGTALPVLNGGTGSTTSTGTGSVVLANTPTLITPIIGDATGTSLSVSGQLISTISSGTAPLAVTSTTVVTNLNANLLNGASFTSPGPIGNTTANTGTFTTINTSGLITSGNGLTISLGILTAITSTFSGAMNMNSNKINNLGTPSLDSDAATKAYVDNAIQGLDAKQSVIVASTVNGTLSSSFANDQVIDGITLVTGYRILIWQQTVQTENGIYIVNSTGSPTRSSDFAIGSLGSGMFVFVEQGTSYANTGFVCNSVAGSDIVGTNIITFVQFSGAGQIIAGTGLTKTGNSLSVNTSQTQITSIGTLTGLSVISGISLSGSVSGIINLQTQSAAGTYNYNLPTTAGTSGQVLTSGGGGSTAMLWTTPTIGTVTSVAISVPTFLSVSGSPITTNGTLTVTLSGTSLPVLNGGTGSTTSTGSGSVVLANTPTLITPIIGAATGTSLSVSGNVNSLTQTITGSTSGVITIRGQAISGTYNYNLPTTAGTSGQVLTSGGGLTAAMTWTTAGTGTVTSVALSVPTFLSVSGSPITTNGTLAVTLSGTALPVLNGGTGSTTATGSGSVVLANTPTLITPIIGVATGTSLSVSGNVNSLTQTITGSTSGVINIQGQAAAGTYNYNLPTTAGTSGQVLTSGGGVIAAMTWTTPTIGTVTSVALSVPTFLSVSGSPITTNGTLTVTLSGTALPVLNGGTGSTTATGTGSVVLANTPTLITPIIGVATGTSLSVSGNVNSLTQTITGSTSGVITIRGQAISGTYNYNLPTTAGTSGQVLTSGGGLTAAMTWTTAGTGTVTSVALSVPTFLSVSGSPITTNGTLAVTLSGTALPVLNGGTGSTTATGSGSVVLANTPTLITPIIGVATGTSLSVSGQLTSTITTGTAPLVVTSTTNVANLNASSLNGATFSIPGPIGNTTASTGAFTTITAAGLITANLGLTIANGQTTNIGTSGITSTLNIYALTDIFGSTAFTGIGSTTITNSTVYVAPVSTAVSGANNYYFSYFDIPSTTGTTTGSAYNIYIEGAPAGTITNSYALYVNSGISYFGDTIRIPTGATTNYVLTSDAIGNANWQMPQAMYYIASDTTLRTLISVTLTDIPLMTLTPVAGTYLATFSGTTLLSNAGRILSLRFAKNGILVPNSLSQVTYSNTVQTGSITAPVTCNGTDIITVQWAVSANSVSTPVNSLRTFTLVAVV